MELTEPLATYSVIFCVDRNVWSEVSLGLLDLWLGLRGSKKSRIQSIHSQKEPHVASGWIEDFFGAFETSHLVIWAWISVSIQLPHQRGNPGAAASICNAEVSSELASTGDAVQDLKSTGSLRKLHWFLVASRWLTEVGLKQSTQPCWLC